MSQTDRTLKAHPAEPADVHPSVKVYTPRLEEFEKDVADAIARYHELPDWLKAGTKQRFRSR